MQNYGDSTGPPPRLRWLKKRAGLRHINIDRHFCRSAVVAWILLVSAVSLSAQEESREGNSPLSGGDVVIAAGAGIPYYVGGGFASLWGAALVTEVVIGRTALSHPIELTYGAGAAGSVIFGDPLSWSAGAFATAHLFLARNFGTYSRVGLGYFRWGIGIPVYDQLTSGIRFLAAGGLEYFVSDQFAIYVEGGWWWPLTAGVRVRL